MAESLSMFSNVWPALCPRCGKTYLTRRSPRGTEVHRRKRRLQHCMTCDAARSPGPKEQP